MCSVMIIITKCDAVLFLIVKSIVSLCIIQPHQLNSKTVEQYNRRNDENIDAVLFHQENKSFQTQMAIEKEDEVEMKEDCVELIKQWEVRLLRKMIFLIERTSSTSKVCNM